MERYRRNPLEVDDIAPSDLQRQPQKQQIDWLRWAGIATCLIGVYFVFRLFDGKLGVKKVEE